MRDGRVLALDVDTLTKERHIVSHTQPVTALHLTDESDGLVSGDDGGALVVAPFRKASATSEKVLRLPSPAAVNDIDNPGRVLTVNSIDHGRIVVAVTKMFVIGVWETEFKRNLFARPQTIYPGFTTGLASASISTDGRKLLAVTDDGHTMYVDLAASESRVTSEAPDAAARKR